MKIDWLNAFWLIILILWCVISHINNRLLNREVSEITKELIRSNKILGDILEDFESNDKYSILLDKYRKPIKRLISDYDDD